MEYKLLCWKDGDCIGEIRRIKSLQWQEKYADVGEIKLVCAATDANLEMLQSGNLLQNTERPSLRAVIRQIEIEDDLKNPQMTVRAKMTADRLCERVVMHTEQIGKAETGMISVLQKNLRGLPLAVAAESGFAERFDGQISWGSVLDAEKKIAAASGLGFCVTADEEQKETFRTYKGIDRTDPASPEYIGFLGDTSGTLAKIRLVEEDSDTKNVAIVCGKGKGDARSVETVDVSAGMPRREMYVDADDITLEYQDADGTQHTWTDAEYRALLRTRGLEKLTQHRGGISFTAELRQTMLQFAKDYELGDILPLAVSKYGILAKCRVAQIVMTYEEGKKTVEAVLEVVL